MNSESRLEQDEEKEIAALFVSATHLYSEGNWGTGQLVRRGVAVLLTSFALMSRVTCPYNHHLSPQECTLDSDPQESCSLEDGVGTEIWEADNVCMYSYITTTTGTPLSSPSV